MLCYLTLTHIEALDPSAVTALARGCPHLTSLRIYHHTPSSSKSIGTCRTAPATSSASTTGTTSTDATNSSWGWRLSGLTFAALANCRRLRELAVHDHVPPELSALSLSGAAATVDLAYVLSRLALRLAAWRRWDGDATGARGGGGGLGRRPPGPVGGAVKVYGASRHLPEVLCRWALRRVVVQQQKLLQAQRPNLSVWWDLKLMGGGRQHCYDSLSALPRLELDLRVVPPDSELRLAAPWRPPAASRLCLLVRAGIRRSPFSNEAAAEEAVQQPAALLQAGGAAAAQALQAGATPADAAAIARHHWGDAELTCAAADHEDVDAPTAALLRWLPYQLPDLYGLSLPYDAVGGRGLALLGAGLTRLCKLSLGHVALRSGQHGVLEPLGRMPCLAVLRFGRITVLVVPPERPFISYDAAVQLNRELESKAIAVGVDDVAGASGATVSRGCLRAALSLFERGLSS
eukprot:XP_001699412.1 predicted protein [Chlamydomonas reinhardtii]